MELVYDALKVVHIAAWILVVLGYLKSIKNPTINDLMTHALEAAFVVGVLLVGLAAMSDDIDDPNHVKIAVKLGVALAAVGVAHAFRKRPAPNPFAHLVAALVLANVVIAYAWR